MATVIRMRRGGRTHKPYYRVVVQDSRSRDRGPEVDTLGIYHPCSRPEPISEVNVQKALEWLRKGAQPSDTVRGLLSKLGVMKHFNDGTTPEEPIALLKGSRIVEKGYNAPPPVAEEPEKETPAPEAAPVEEAPAEETPAEEAPAVAMEAASEESPAEEAKAESEEA